MQADSAYYALTVDPEALRKIDWEEIGDETDPRERLLTAVLIAGVPHHVEAIAVEQVKDPDPDTRPRQVAVSPSYDGILHHYYCADSGTDEPFLTVEIGGRSYCLFMTPYRE